MSDDEDEGKMHYSSGGFINFLDGMPPARRWSSAAEETKRQPISGPRVTLAGYASMFNKVHFDSKGERIEVFAPGCFARGLHDGRAIRFLVGHREGKCIATSADTLELLSDDVGLAFKCAVSPGGYADEAIALARTNAASMSVGYRVAKDDVQEIENHKVRILLDVSLEEISIGPPGKGAVKEAFAFVLSDNTQTLQQLCESKSLANEWSSVAFRRALGGFADRLTTGLASK